MSQPPASDPALPLQVADWIGTVVIIEEGGIVAERGLIEAFAVAIEDANPLFWNEATATEIAEGLIAPPAMLSAWTRPHGWSPSGKAPQRPLELHFRLKEVFALPKAVVIETDSSFYEPVRPGDRVRAEQILDQVGPMTETRLGAGRRWTISIRYTRRDEVLLGVETLKFFAYGGVGVASGENANQTASPLEGEVGPQGRVGGPANAFSPTADERQHHPPPVNAAHCRPPPQGGRRLAESDQVQAGAAIPPLNVTMTATRIIMGAAASRDWQHQHHDSHHAQASGLPDIILNAPAQSGWLNRYLTDWAGPEARIGRLKFRMVKPIVAGGAVTIQGSVEAAAETDQGWRWLRIALTISTGGLVATDATALLAVPLTRPPWRADSGTWHIPGWDFAGLDPQGVSG